MGESNEEESSPRARVKRAAKPEMTPPDRAYRVRPGEEIDYDALCSEVNDRFPYILKRLAD
jgi:hypothetical protein